MSFQPGTKLPVHKIAITQALIDAYAEISGDFNPIHVDPAAGEAAGFGSSIAHGCLPLEPLFQSVRSLLGRELPADTKLSLRYLGPSRPGDTIRSEAEIAEVADSESGRALVRAIFVCLNQRDEAVIKGEVRFTP